MNDLLFTEKMENPSVKDLPKIADTLKGELEKDHQLKKTEVQRPLPPQIIGKNLTKMLFCLQVTEKVVLPSAEDLKAEKTHESLLQGVETFSPEKLNPTKTREPASASDGKLKIYKILIVS